ncbi:MAG TPA: class I SAM-dependent methyltransferase [Caulobacteraceae bacterium]|jgi:SAM-dependent MidA family methyltransferase|nr:class I SAM-dependent methyltransferase [Caulobacteraceae bacterium]
MNLLRRLEARILQDGPLTIADYMTACLHDPQDGYYATRPRLGAEGDFITAPMVSQMFGELIGLWCVEVWTRMGAPSPFALVEMGPGDGTLMDDALRAARLVPAFAAAAEVWLVETSAPLRALQAERLAGAGPRWAASLDDVPRGAPLIFVANELLDCLPARQFVRTHDGWAERRVGLDGQGALAFGLAPAPAGLKLAPAARGAVIEVSTAQVALGARIGERISADGGAALFIDYGRDRPETGDTLQALRRHVKVPPLEAPGEADLTVHADFPAFAAAARSAGVETTPIRTQAAFLQALGIEARAAALSQARPERAQAIARQLARLTAPGEMGALFKAVAIHSPGLAMPGFEA